MINRRLQFWIGLAVFLLGGLVLAIASEPASTALGTTMGLAGLGLMVWAWAKRGPAS